MKDYYKILGISKDATQSDIKKAYRKLSKLYHPDMGKEASDDKFKDISEAYSVLSDEDKRRQYDNPSPFGNMGSSSGDHPFGGFEDFFDSFFGRSSRKYQGNHNNHIRINLSITLDEVETGSTKKIRYKRKTQCSGCNGMGGQSTLCPTCNGSGSIITETSTPIGTIQQQTICHTCGGKGRKIVSKCGKCNGQSTFVNEEELEIKTPVGVSEGVTYKYEGKGNTDQYGTGDLLIQFNIAQHHFFQRQGLNLLCEIKVPFNILVTGGKVDIPLLNNKKTRIDIPEMTKPGYRLRIKGMGMSNYDTNNKGDIIVMISVDFPNNITEEELEIIKKLEGKPNFIYNQK